MHYGDFVMHSSKTCSLALIHHLETEDFFLWCFSDPGYESLRSGRTIYGESHGHVPPADAKTHVGPTTGGTQWPRGTGAVCQSFQAKTHQTGLHSGKRRKNLSLFSITCHENPVSKPICKMFYMSPLFSANTLEHIWSFPVTVFLYLCFLIWTKWGSHSTHQPVFSNG